jgi:hypothetical protein
MKQIKDHTWHDQRRVEFELDDENGGYDRYEAFVDFWFVNEPDVNYKSVDEVYINSLIKNGEEVNFIKQSDIRIEVHDAIVNQLEDVI